MLAGGAQHHGTDFVVGVCHIVGIGDGVDQVGVEEVVRRPADLDDLHAALLPRPDVAKDLFTAVVLNRCAHFRVSSPRELLPPDPPS